ncbi:MAG: FN3 domain-containing metallophosphoesterase family protein [Rikenellaceae bacterium]
MKKLTLIAALLLTSLATKAQELMVNLPYLQNPTNNTITVTWLTSKPSYSYVEYGTDTTQIKQVATIVDGQKLAGNTVNNILLEGIIPGVEYYYRATSKEMTVNGGYKKEFGDSVTTPFFKFKIPKAKDNYKALVLNDLHQHRETVDRIAELTQDLDYNIVIFNGDCIDDPNSQQQAISFVAHLSQKLGKGSIPFVFIRGNHEIRGAYSVFLREIITYATERSFGGFDWSDTRFVILDCGEDKPDSHWVYYGLNDFEDFRVEQVDYLKEELASKAFKKSRNQVLIHHIPLYSPDITYNPCYDLWHPILSSAKFDIALNAHMHKWAAYEKGEMLGNNFPVVVGGGYKLEDATMIVVERSEEALTTTMYDMQGEVLYTK